MNTAQQKLAVWTVTGALGAGMAAYLALSLANFDEYRKAVSKEVMFETLSKVPDVAERQENVIAAAMVDRGLKFLDWTGKPPPERPVDEGPVAGDEAAPREQVRDLLQVRGIRFDAEAPAQSEVVFKYLSTAMVTAPTNSDGTYLKRAGDRLDGRLNQIEISAIYPNAVEFNFTNEPGREKELVAPRPFDLSKHYAYIGEGGVALTRNDTVQAYISRRADGPPPAETVQISPTKYRVGTDDAQRINENFAEIMTSEVTIDRHRDPRTKRFDGVEVKHVKPGSIAARHGVEDGDVIKSINGHPVTSKEDAVVYVKNNKDNFDTWEVEIWNRGQTRTVTYYSPKK